MTTSFRAEIIDLLEQSRNQMLEQFEKAQPYDMDVLRRIRDFRVLVNLSYVVQLAERLGVATKLAPVLSFPLGSNAVTIAEAALAYQTLLTGYRFAVGAGSDQDSQMIPMIMRIVDREGDALWTYEPSPTRVISPEVSAMVSEILRMAVEQGTGSQAKGAVKVRFETGDTPLSIPVPAYGKTGTANRFTNSSFVGHVPGPDPRSGLLTTEAGYTIGCYVGYDDNRPMKSDRFAVYGASGGLPHLDRHRNGRRESAKLQEDATAGRPGLRRVARRRRGRNAVACSRLTTNRAGTSGPSARRRHLYGFSGCPA